MNENMLIGRLKTLARTSYGHFWTITPHLEGRVRRWWSGPAHRLEVRYTTERGIQLTAGGYLHRRPDSKALFILVHGLGGTVDSAYIRYAAHRFWSLGYSVLRVALRGSEGDQPDFYNAGQTQDLEYLLKTPVVRQYDRRYLIGFSLGGHISLTLATDAIGSNCLNGVVSICAPLDLHQTQVWLDRPRINPYRTHCLKGLKRTLNSVKSIAESRQIHLPISWEDIPSISRIREWDEYVVCPRFGFDTVDDYYRQVSVGPKLHTLKKPTLIVASKHDPMVPVASITPYIGQAKADYWALDHGAHVGFPKRVSTGIDPTACLYESISRWCSRH